MEKLELTRTNPVPKSENRKAIPSGSNFEKLFGSTQCETDNIRLFTAAVSHPDVDQNCLMCILSENFSIVSQDAGSAALGFINYERKTYPRQVGVPTDSEVEWKWIDSLGVRLSNPVDWHFSKGIMWTKYGKITSEGNDLIFTVRGKNKDEDISAPFKSKKVTNENAVDLSGCSTK